MSSPSRLPHLVRGTGAAAIATFAALFAHMLGGGAMPSPLGIVVPLLLSLMVSVLLAGRTLSLWRLSISVVLSQTLFHTLFVLGTPTAAGASALTDMAASSHAHGMASMAGMAMPTMAPLAPASAGTLALVQGDAVMWLSHLLGAAVTTAFLYRGERAMLRLRRLAERFVGWLRHRLVAPLQVLIQRVPARIRATWAPGWTVLAQLHASTLSRRGPPMSVRFASYIAPC